MRLSKLLFLVELGRHSHSLFPLKYIYIWHFLLLPDINMTHMPPNSNNCLTLANAAYQFTLLWPVSFRKSHKVNCAMIQ